MQSIIRKFPSPITGRPRPFLVFRWEKDGKVFYLDLTAWNKARTVDGVPYYRLNVQRSADGKRPEAVMIPAGFTTKKHFDENAVLVEAET